jgi:hypothetical protein
MGGTMRSAFPVILVLAMIAASPVYARSGHGHRHQLHRHSTTGSSTSADQKKADTRPPEKRDPEDTKIDKRIRSICQGC